VRHWGTKQQQCQQGRAQPGRLTSFGVRESWQKKSGLLRRKESRSREGAGAWARKKTAVGVLLRGSWFRDERKAEARWTGWMKLGRGSGDGGRDEQRQQAATVVNLCNARHNRQSHPRSIPLTGRDALVFFRRGLPQGAAPPSVSVSSEGRTALEPWSPGGSPSRDAPLLRRHVPGYDWLRLAGLTCPANSRPR